MLVLNGMPKELCEMCAKRKQEQEEIKKKFLDAIKKAKSNPEKKTKKFKGFQGNPL